MKHLVSIAKKYIADEKGSGTLEWVGISAVVFVAAIGITAFILESADGLGGAVAGQMDNAAAAISGDNGGGTDGGTTTP